MAESSLIFISGGVRSGKSRFAEKLAAEEAAISGGCLHYIAAGQASDAEMKERIIRHQKDRLESGLSWRTWEKPVKLKELTSVFSKTDIVLLDCLTTLLNNEFFSQGENWQKPQFQQRIIREILEGVEHIAQNSRLLLVVSNEVLNEPLADNELVMVYGRMLGHLHQQVAAKAKAAYLVESGIPISMKGKG